MKKQIHRRDFLSRLSLGITSMIAITFPGYGKNKDFSDMNNNQSSANPTILGVRALGFQWETKDPFLFCVHHEDKYPKGNKDMGPSCSLDGRHIGQDFILKDGFRMYHGEKIPGFPGHPHRGFETITVVREGMVDHADSLGAAGRYGDGDVQWMTAGKGVQHSEMFPLLDENKDNPLELFQIWLNLPRKSKMVDPHFTMLWGENIPIIKVEDKNGITTEIEVVAGKLEDKSAPSPPPNSWANDALNHVAVWNIKIDKNGTWTLPKAAPGLNRTLYFYKGPSIKIAGKNIEYYHAVDLQSDVEVVIENGSTEAKLLLLQGKPIDEPVVQHGPFVMNSKIEIQQAFNDYHQTQFGGWPWSKRDQVHDKSRGRFALHADGKLETKG